MGIIRSPSAIEFSIACFGKSLFCNRGQVSQKSAFSLLYLRNWLLSLCAGTPSLVGLGSFSPIFGFCFLYHFEPRNSPFPWRCTMRTSQVEIGHIGLQEKASKLKNSIGIKLKS